MQRSSCLLPYTLFSLLWSPTNLTVILQLRGELSDFKPLFTCLPLAFFCNPNCAVCSKRICVILSKEKDDISPRESLYQPPWIIYINPLNITYAIRDKQWCNNYYKWVHQGLIVFPIITKDSLLLHIGAPLTIIWGLLSCFILQSVIW